MKKITTIICGLLLGLSIQAQTGSDVYRKPLKQVLDEISQKFDVKLDYRDNQVADKMVEYADWRLSFDADRSLDRVLLPFDLRAEKEADGYRIRPFEYHKRSVAEGKEHLDLLLASYGGLNQWEARRKEIRQNILKKVNLSPLPTKTPLNSRIKEKRVYKGYSVENVMIEVIPGIYLCGNLYKPDKVKGTVPAMLCPHGHFSKGDISKFDFTGWGRFRDDQQIRCAELARLGCVVFSYNMFAQGEMAFQIPYNEHGTPFALTMQTLSSIRALDFITTLKEVDVKRIGITGASGGGTQSFILTALDDRISLAVPAVMVSAHFFGGCACESGLPIHSMNRGLNTCNPEIAAMAAPRPMLLISDGNDWTQNNPSIEYPYLQKVYGLYGKPDKVSLVHLPADVHDYGPTKRLPMYRFVASNFGLDLKRIQGKEGQIDESLCVVEPYNKMLFIKSRSELPVNALRTAAEMKTRLTSLQ